MDGWLQIFCRPSSAVRLRHWLIYVELVRRCGIGYVNDRVTLSDSKVAVVLAFRWSWESYIHHMTIVCGSRRRRVSHILPRHSLLVLLGWRALAKQSNGTANVNPRRNHLIKSPFIFPAHRSRSPARSVCRRVSDLYLLSLLQTVPYHILNRVIRSRVRRLWAPFHGSGARNWEAVEGYKGVHRSCQLWVLRFDLPL